MDRCMHLFSLRQADIHRIEIFELCAGAGSQDPLTQRHLQIERHVSNND